MSTVLYAYRVPKINFWHTFDDIREFYKNEHPIILAAIKKAPDDFHSVMAGLRDLFSHASEYDRYDTRLQLFDFGDDWIFRVLEPGYYFMNHWANFDATPVAYDNRTDVPPEDEPNEEIAKEIDKLIDAGHYFLVPLMDYEFVSRLLWRQAAGATDGQ